MKRGLILLVLPIFISGCLTVPYEFIKGASPYQITVRASFEEFDKAAKDILKEHGYFVEQPYKPCLIGKSNTVDSHVYIEWNTDKKGMIHASLWRIRYNMNPLSIDAKMNNKYETLSPDSEIISIGKELRKRFK